MLLDILARGGGGTPGNAPLLFGSLFMAISLFGLFVSLSRRPWARRLIRRSQWGREPRAPRMGRAGCFLSSMSLGTFAAAALAGGYFHVIDNDHTLGWLLASMGLLAAGALADIARHHARRAERRQRQRDRLGRLAARPEMAGRAAKDPAR